MFQRLAVVVVELAQPCWQQDGRHLWENTETQSILYSARTDRGGSAQQQQQQQQAGCYAARHNHSGHTRLERRTDALFVS